ncbi:unnamed protein product [Cylindrotheca closterium]|uniref:Uncharacterized protein n=1 Tax=Cylindrotheca closterium TaxID=2856 RepID=A0AAD2PXQ6_9STRA|nr:unnamed protein product [Cylindrotheca closterium]
MADAYHPYIPDELPLNIPNNKRREKSIEASSYEATRPSTIAALNESLLSSMVDDSATSSAYFDDVVGYSLGSLGDIDGGANNNKTTATIRPTVYDDEYGLAQTSNHRAHRGESSPWNDGTLDDNDDNDDDYAQSEELVQESAFSSNRGELSGPAIVSPLGKDDHQRDSFADTDEGLPFEDGNHDGSDSDNDVKDGPDALESHVLGLNDLMTLQSQRKYNWKTSSGEIEEYASEMELFDDDDDVDDGDDGIAEDDVVDTKSKPKRISLSLGTFDAEVDSVDASDNEDDDETKTPHKPKSSSRSLQSNNPEEPVPTDIESIKEMNKEDYWNLFNKILHMPTDFEFVPEDPLEFIKRRDAARYAARQEARQPPKPKRQRARRRKSSGGGSSTAPVRCRSTEVFEPPNMKERPRPPRRSSSFSGTTATTTAAAAAAATVRERESSIGHPTHGGNHMLSKLPFMHNVKFHRPKKPEFVAVMQHSTHLFGKKAREATLSFSSKFGHHPHPHHHDHPKKIENRPYNG